LAALRVPIKSGNIIFSIFRLSIGEGDYYSEIDFVTRDKIIGKNERMDVVYSRYGMTVNRILNRCA
jgi:hypothetical protein